MTQVGAEIGSVLDQLDARQPKMVLTIDEDTLPLTNLDKVLWPGAGRKAGFTKRDLLRYLTLVSPWLLPHLKGRPMFTTRYPDGVNGKSFYQKHWDKPPAYARTVTIYSSHNDGDSDYLICENLATLLFLAQMGGLELHPYLYSGREGKGEEPELHRKAFRQTCDLALRLHELLGCLGLQIFVKTS